MERQIAVQTLKDALVRRLLDDGSLTKVVDTLIDAAAARMGIAAVSGHHGNQALEQRIAAIEAQLRGTDDAPVGADLGADIESLSARLAAIEAQLAQPQASLEAALVGATQPTAPAAGTKPRSEKTK